MKIDWPDAKRMVGMLVDNNEAMWKAIWEMLSAPLKRSVELARKGLPHARGSSPCVCTVVGGN